MINFTHSQITEAIAFVRDITTRETMKAMMDTSEQAFILVQDSQKLRMDMIDIITDYLEQHFDTLAEKQLKDFGIQSKIDAIDAQLAQVAASKLRPVSDGLGGKWVPTEHGTVLLDTSGSEPEVD